MSAYEIKNSAGIASPSVTPMYNEEMDEKIKRMVEAEVERRMNILLAKNNLAGERLITTQHPNVKVLPPNLKLRVLVTGGCGFVGSHLVDQLMIQGHQVICLDNMLTGSQRNVMHWIGHPNFQLIVHDVVEPIMLEVEQIYHLACPASPPHYQVSELVSRCMYLLFLFYFHFYFWAV